MYLKELRMQGFKSFPDRTVIEFHEGITAIVGPNGSGKSNITDAILWVLGEQSAKTLRGSRMEDVVFSGTETRRQLGFAEVTIVFDNSDKNIPIEYEIVEVTRRYFRSGDSEYLINQVECRLKDIRALFLDTGIGRDGYSIIGQGKIDQILSDNSEDRRKIFDEAAGIVKYKMRKRDTERKLERTENNLNRIQDILQELNLRINPLKNQVKKLKQYKSLKTEVQNIDIALLLHDISRNTKEITKQKKAVTDLANDLADARKLANDLKENYRKYDHDLTEIDLEIEKLRLQHSKQNADLAEFGERKAIAKERQRSITTQLKRDKEQLLELSHTLQYLDSDLEDKDLKRKEFIQVVSELKEKFTVKSKNLKIHKDKNDKLENEIHTSRKALEDKRNYVFKLKNNKSSQEQEMQFINNQWQELDQELLELNKEISQKNQAIENQTRMFNKKAKSFKEMSADLQEARTAVEIKRKELGKLDEKKQKLKNQINNSQYRLKTLQQLEANREGFRHAVKAIMQNADQDKEFGQGVHGPLAELISVPKKYEKSIEVSLGSALNHIVTETKTVASRLIDWLKTTRSGRETFLPIDIIQGNDIALTELNTIKDVEGFLGVANKQVEFDKLYQGIINQLLGRVILAEDLTAALKISEILKRRYRVVTLEGDIVQVGGSMTGGLAKQGSPGLLRRNREINECQEALQNHEKDLLAIQTLVEDKTRKLLNLGQVQTDLEEEYLAAEKNLYTIENKLHQNNRDLNQIKNNLQNKKNNLHKFSQRIDEIKSSLESKNEDLIKTEESLQKEESNLNSFESKKESLEKGLVELQKQVMEANVLFQTKQQALDNLLELSLKTKEDLTQQQIRQANLRRDMKKAKAELKSLVAEETSYANNYLSLEKILSALLENIKNQERVRFEVEKQQRRLFSQVEQQADQVSNLQVELERSKQKTERLEHSITTSKNRIWESYELTYVELALENYPLESISDSRERLRKLKVEVKNLGPINLNAATEYEEISERYDFMNLQLEDIEKAKTSLTDVITELEAAMSDQFASNFAKINKNFKDVFSALFIGGEAELVLEDDDLLTSGIQIKAQPPGKRLQNLNLLSGGERSLTAIALLLAIFRLRPAPFCVLDEVESALDESNIIRFTDYLEKYTKQSQFILVTHRKGTMESADRLYGITMKERGVSKVLSLALTDHDALNSDEKLSIR